MLRIKQLKVQFGEQIALDIQEEIDFQKNDRIGIIGSNGAGKSTLINVLLGMTTFEGEIETDLTTADMAVHLQENNYSSNVSVKLVIETILETKIKTNPELSELIAYFDFEKCLSKKFNKLSGGQKQRLTLIMVLMQKAQITFLDEVSSGLDFETRQMLMNKLNEWYADKELTLCVVSHYYDELEKLTNKLLVLEQGVVVAFGTQKELFQKYCGYSVITVEETQQTKTLFKHEQKLGAPAQVLALVCADAAAEKLIIATCIQHNLNYKRRNNDIEIMSINAKLKEGF